MLDWTIESAARDTGYGWICGVDEAGRGPLAGPVCAAAVILPFGCTIDGLDDSKKLSEKKREALYDAICAQALAYSVALVDNQTIDRINILEATFQAMRQAVQGLSPAADYALVDGNRSKGLDIAHACIIGGDGKSPSIAAASILAKVTRDRLMREYDKQYPAYGFAGHKGYGTKAHHAALLAHGPCPLHRRSFLQKFYERHPEARR